MTGNRNLSGVNTHQARATVVVLMLIAFMFVQGAVLKAQDQQQPAPANPAPRQSPAPADPAPRQSPAPASPAPAQSPAPGAVPTPPSIRDIVEVTKVYNLKDSSPEAGLNDIIMIDVTNLEALQLKANCEKPYNQDCSKKDIILYLEGRPFKGLLPESGAPTLVDPPKATNGATTTQRPQFLNGTLRYHLQRDAPGCGQGQDCNEYWADMLGFSTNPAHWSLRRQVEVSVGLADEYPVRTQVKPGTDKAFSLIRIRSYRLPLWIIFTLLCIAALIWLAKRRGLLSDRAPVLWRQRKPYSLSACQAACWFIVILISFVFIWLVTGQYDFSSTALILLGIGSGTALTATLMDSSRRTQTTQPQIESTELNQLLADKQRLEGELTDLERTGPRPAFDQKMREYTAKIAEIRQKFPNAIGPPHERFFIDILSDASGVNFHRFQMLIWTLVLSVFFVLSVLGKLSMPDFSTTLLMLMGISAGTYLGFKANENTNTPAPQNVNPAAGGGGQPQGGGGQPQGGGGQPQGGGGQPQGGGGQPQGGGGQPQGGGGKPQGGGGQPQGGGG